MIGNSNSIFVTALSAVWKPLVTPFQRRPLVARTLRRPPDLVRAVKPVERFTPGPEKPPALPVWRPWLATVHGPAPLRVGNSTAPVGIGLMCVSSGGFQPENF